MGNPARTPSRRRLRRRAGGFLVVVAALAGCGESGTTRDPAAERGRQIYLAQCISCHNADPALPGAVGPAVRGSSQELLEAKLVRGAYPPGYTPKRPTAVMPPQPGLAPDVPNLFAFLR
jgi:mono/diheme cytochrome c family protein